MYLFLGHIARGHFNMSIKVLRVPFQVQDLSSDVDLYTDDDIRIFYETLNGWIRFELLQVKNTGLYGLLNKSGGNTRYDNQANIVSALASYYINDDPTVLPGGTARFQTANMNDLRTSIRIQQSATEVSLYNSWFFYYAGGNMTTHLLGYTDVYLQV